MFNDIERDSSIFDKLEHLRKVYSSIVFNKGGSLNVLKDLQCAKA